jgi:hypothetical protein
MDRLNLPVLLLILMAIVGPREAENLTARVESMFQGAAKPDVHIWYVRSDGGDRKQCTGHGDAAYSGKGNAQPCALKHPYYLFTNGEYGNKQWIVQGGDTVILRGGPYRIGFRGPNREDNWSSCPGDAYACGIPPLPSGMPGHPTRFLGENYGKCSKKTQLFGGFEVYIMMDLSGAKNVDLECLELTDHSQCTRVGGGYPTAEGCTAPHTGLGDYAASAIATDARTGDVTLKDLDIHGLTSRGIIGPVGGVVTVERVRIAFNGGAGWDFDDGKGAKSGDAAAVHASYLTVEWNGCNEEYPIAHPIPVFSCFDQDHGGYGDGIGTPNTPLNFTCDHCVFRYNTQDGFDLLHIKGSEITVTNSVSYGNMGQQWKMGTMKRVVFQNNLTVNNCRRMSAPIEGAQDRYHRDLSLFCRAGGDGIVFSVTDGGTYIFQHNSFAGYGGSSYDVTCDGGCSSAKIIYQNNLMIGYKDPASEKLPAIFYLTDVPSGAFEARDHNVYFNMRGTCPVKTTEHCWDPKIAGMPEWRGEASLDGINFHLTSGSQARGAGVANAGPQKDFDGVARPTGAPPDIGAFQFHQ